MGIKYTEHLIRSYYSGPLGSVLNQIMAMLYRWFGISRARQAGESRIRLVLELASKYDGTNLDQLRSEYLNEYISSHPIYIRANKSHPKLNQLIQILARDFDTRLEFLSRLLRSSGSNLEELSRNAYSSQQAKEAIQRQIEASKELLQLINSDPKLLQIPALIRRQVIRILNQVEQYAAQRLQQRWKSSYALDCSAT